MKSKHTPGPWHWNENILENKHGDCILWPSNIGSEPETAREKLGSCGKHKVENEETAQANMNIIEAAPISLEILMKMVECKNNGDPINWKEIEDLVNNFK